MDTGTTTTRMEVFPRHHKLNENIILFHCFYSSHKEAVSMYFLIPETHMKLRICYFFENSFFFAQVTILDSQKFLSPHKREK